ncbi:MAG: Pentapeptide repeat protein [candidate division TM6 bacterium GW2011_GWF2_28_16]|nr:MAG: Pentapeptide repeat protein [candidate division TM6 bacterium GW2011_GWF2_28_16]
MKNFFKIYVLFSLLFSSRYVFGMSDDDYNRYYFKSYSNQVLRDCDLSGYNFIGEDLVCTSFNRSILKQAKFFKANANNATFIDAHLESANLTGGFFRRAYFTGAYLNNVVAYVLVEKKGKIFEYCANFIKADFTGADLTGAVFKKAYLSRANFDGAIVKDLDLEGAVGLTNEQKQYMRDNGAINVPADLTEQEFKEEWLAIKKKYHSTLKTIFDNSLGLLLLPLAKIVNFTVDSGERLYDKIFIGLREFGIKSWQEVKNLNEKTQRKLLKYLIEKYPEIKEYPEIVEEQVKN